MNVGDLVNINKQEGSSELVGKRGLITEIIQYTRYGPEKSGPIPSAILLVSNKTVIFPLDSLGKISER